MSIPRIISVDDHVVEPPDLWSDRMPEKYRHRGPSVTREKGAAIPVEGMMSWVADDGLDGANWADVWRYGDLVWPLTRGYAMSGYESDDAYRPITYDEVLPATFNRSARLELLDANHTDASICYPTFPRFCGQIFLESEDKEVALVALQVYNDWMIDEWCGSERPARLIPLTLIPLWDPELAAREVHRCAAKGSHAIAFSECPPYLGLPSIYSGHWDPLFKACSETDTVVNLHVGSASKLVVTAADAPGDMTLCLTYINSLLAFSDYLYSGIFELFPDLKISLAESQAGWIPFAAERIDNTWKKGNEKFTESITKGRRATVLPSSQVRDHIFACVFDDLEGLKNRETVGVNQILFETDFPHSDSTYPHSKKTLEELVSSAGLTEDETYLVTRGNAIALYGLDKYFGIES